MNRRNFVKGIGGVLSLPLLESLALDKTGRVPTRFLVVGNPLGMHPEHFFPLEYGKNVPFVTDASIAQLAQGPHHDTFTY